MEGTRSPAPKHNTIEELDSAYERSCRMLKGYLAAISILVPLLTCSGTYLVSRGEPREGLRSPATDTIRLLSPNYRRLVTLPDGFMPSCSDFNDTFKDDEGYPLKAFFGGCEVYPLENSFDGKSQIVLVVRDNFVERNFAPDGNFRLGIAKVSKVGGLFQLLDYTEATPGCMGNVGIDRGRPTRYECIVDSRKFDIGISQVGEISVKSPGNGVLLYQKNSTTTVSTETSLAESLKSMAKSPWIYIVGLVLVIRQVNIFLGSGAQEIIKAKTSDGDEFKVKRKAIYGPKAVLALLFGGSKYKHIVISTATGAAETAEVAKGLASIGGLGKALRAFILGR